MGKFKVALNFLDWILTRIVKAEQAIGDGKVELILGRVNVEVPARNQWGRTESSFGEACGVWRSMCASVAQT